MKLTVKLSSTCAVLGISASASPAKAAALSAAWHPQSKKAAGESVLAMQTYLAGTHQLLRVWPRESAPSEGTYLDDAHLPLVIRRGLPFACAQNVASLLELPMTRLYDLISISSTTAHRRQKQQVFNSAESDRLARIARITAEAVRIFGDVGTAKRWLSRKHVVLANATPLELLDTDSGAEQVADELIRIEFGELAA